MFNVKDVPVATGYSLMTLALVAMVVPHRAVGSCAWPGSPSASCSWSAPARPWSPRCSWPRPCWSGGVLRGVRRQPPGARRGGCRVGARRRGPGRALPGVFAHPVLLSGRSGSRRASATTTAPATSTSRSTSSPSSRCSSRPCSASGCGPRSPSWLGAAGSTQPRHPVGPGRRAGRRASARRGGQELRPLQRPAPAAVRLAGVGGAGHPRAGPRADLGPARGRTGWSAASPSWRSWRRWSTRPRSSPTSTAASTRPRRHRHTRRLGLLAHQRPRAAAGHPHRRPGRLRTDPLHPARGARGQPGGDGVDEDRMTAGPLLLRQQRRLPDRPARAARLGVAAGGPAARRRAAARRVLRRHRPRPPVPRNCTRLAGVDPAPARPRDRDDLRRALPAGRRGRSTSRCAFTHPRARTWPRRCGRSRPRAG